MDILTLVATVVSVVGSVAGLLSIFYKYGFNPQLETIRKILCDVKDTVSENSKELSRHGERLARVEERQKLMPLNPGCKEEEKEG